jgi:hypothetical protein
LLADVGDQAARERHVVLDPRRRALQAFLTGTEEGLCALAHRLHSKTYRIDAPEEGCLMVYAWLCERGRVEQANELLATVEPFFDRLRFHPTPTGQPDDFSRVSITGVDQLLAWVESHCTENRESAPLKPCEIGKTRVLFWDQYIRLWLSTLDEVATPPNGQFIREDQSTKRRFVISQDSAWPCQSYPPSWNDQAEALLRFYTDHEATLSTTSIYITAVEFVRRAMQDRRSLTGRDVGQIRWWLASTNAKRGLPGDGRYDQRLASTLVSLDTDIRLPPSSQFYKELAMFIRRHVDSDSINSLSRSGVDEVFAAMTTKFPNSKLLKKLRRRLSLAMAMTCEELYNSDLVGSPEAMAAPLATFASEALASCVHDDSAQYLYKQLHRSFLGRRSLLLLNFASQVRITALPWVAALDLELDTSQLKSQDLSEINAFVRRTVGLSIRRYGESPMRNPFVRVLGILFKATGTECVLLEELAADIFEGGFVRKFAQIHDQAKVLLAGSCYDRYYNICEISLHQEKHPRSSKTPDTFSPLCKARAERNQSANRHKSYVACNGMVIEQAQILTTHNMATLFDTYSLASDLANWDVPSIIRRGLHLILKKLHRVHSIETRTAQVSGSIGPLLRDVGGLWRQLVFWFTILEKYDTPERYAAMVDELVATALSENAHQRCRLDKYQNHFLELVRVLRGRDELGPERVVLGWSA